MRRSTPPEEKQLPIEILVEDFQKDSEALKETFKRIFKRYFRRIIRFFTSRGIPDVEAEDLAQEVLLSVYKGLSTFRSEAGFNTWLFQIMLNRWKNVQRSKTTLAARATKIPLDSLNTEGPARTELREDEDRSPARRLLRDEQRQAVWQSLETLPRRMRLCLQLRLSHDLTNKEIAALLDISPATVKKQLSLAVV